MSSQTSDSVRDTVRENYGAIAQGQSSCCGPTNCCDSNAGDLAERLGYDPTDLSQIPEDANLGLSCGNPTAIASLQPGETIVDLGSGAGFDCFIAGPKVGAEGRVIGVDMTPDMLAKARKNLAHYRERTGFDNVEFRLGEIEHLPLPDNSVDVIISNCVINLSPDQPQVWQEIGRVLKPGGRVAVSDMALKLPLPDAVRESVAALIGCVAGASLISDVQKMMHDAGLEGIKLEEKSGNFAAMIDKNAPMYKDMAEALPEGRTADDYVCSANFTATKPAASVWSSEVAELVALGSSVAANCEPCFQHHFGQLQQLGVQIKSAPDEAMLNLARRSLMPGAQAQAQGGCCGGNGGGGGCCS